jgi:hypothetical protein
VISNNTTPPVRTSYCLSDLPVLYKSDGNFYYNRWNELDKLRIGDQEYDKGIGMCINGTESEMPVALEYSADSGQPSNYREAYIEYDLSYNYSALTFSAGVDKFDTSAFDINDVDKRARIVISDRDNNLILYDSKWQDYSYKELDYTIEKLSKVKTLRITFRSNGDGKGDYNNGLHFVLGKLDLLLIDDP